MPRPANRLARRCEAVAPVELGSRPCERAFGAGGHELAANRWSDSRSTGVLGPVLIHEYLDRDVNVVRRWTRFRILPDRRKTQDET